MGFLSSFIGGITGSDAKKAARGAADAQSGAIDEAKIVTSDKAKEARGYLDPYAKAGTDTLPGYTSLVNDPNAQRDYVANNPFFKSLADDAQSRLFKNAAAKGKLGTGGTVEALQNSLLLLGNDLVNQGITQRRGLVDIGQNAANNQASITSNEGSNLSNLITDKGAAQAAGIVGAANATTGAAQNILGTIVQGAKTAAMASAGMPGGGASLYSLGA